MERDTVMEIRTMIEERVERKRAEWDSMEKGTSESWAALMVLEALSDLKWDIMDALYAEEDAAQGI